MTSVREEQVNGHRALTLDGDQLSVTVLPDKGADIYRLVYKPLDLDVLFKDPAGLRAPGEPPRPGHGDMAFLYNYEGAWQELFPNTDDAVVYRGQTLPFHGETPLRAWRSHETDDGGLHLSVDLELLPLRLERVMHLRETALVLTETVTNLSADSVDFTWGHHCVVGEPFLERGCRMETSARTLVTKPVIYEPATASLAPGQREAFPMARTRDGGWIDLREIPGREAHTHDDVYLTDLDTGWIAVTNPRLALTFSLHWDAQVFRWITCWQIFGGADAPPFDGLPYGLGIEPWVSNLPLDQAVAHGTALQLPPHGVLSTVVEARFTPLTASV